MGGVCVMRGVRWGLKGFGCDGCCQSLPSSAHPAPTRSLAQDALQVDLFEEREDVEPRAALVLVQGGQHAGALGAGLGGGWLVGWGG